MFKHSIKLFAAALMALLTLPLLAQDNPASLAPPIPKIAPANDNASPAAVATTPSTRPQLNTADVDAWLDGYMPYALARGDVAGAVVVVVKDGQVLTQRGFGYADVAARKKVDPATTMFRPGSVSKLFTWTAVMQLVEQGKIDLNADVNQYLDFKIPPYKGKPITMLNIMTHTPGFEEAIRSLIAYDPPVTPLGAAVKRWTPDRVYAPGSTPAYSNYATALAGYIVERLSGMPFDDYIDRNIFGRLGMAHATTRQPLPAKLAPFMSKGYKLGSGDPQKYELISMSPAGSSAVSGGDMAKFMIAHLSQGGPLLKPETTRLMHSPANVIIPGLNRMMHGFYEQQINGQSAIAHGGDTQFFHSDLTLFPQENVGVYISMNSSGKDGASGPIRSALVGEFADRYFPEPAAASATAPVDAATAREHARMMVGTYASSRGPVNNFAAALGLLGQAKVGVDKDGKLSIPSMTTIGGAPHKWTEVSPFIWESADGEARLGAVVANGKVVRWSLSDFAPIMVFDRVPWNLDSAWLLPILMAGLAILLVTALAWPVAAIARRRFGATLAYQGNDLMAYRLVRGFAWAVLLVLIGWSFLLTSMFADLSTHEGLIFWIWTLEIVGTIAFLGMFALALWNAWLAFKGKRGWFAKLWSVLLVIAAFFVLWVAFSFNLISFGANF